MHHAKRLHTTMSQAYQTHLFRRVHILACRTVSQFLSLSLPIWPLTWCVCCEGPAGIAETAERCPVLPAAHAAPADQQCPAPEPGSCTAGKQSCRKKRIG